MSITVEAATDPTLQRFCAGFAEGYVAGWNGVIVVDTTNGQLFDTRTFLGGESGMLATQVRSQIGMSLHHISPTIPPCRIEVGDNDENSIEPSFDKGKRKGVIRGIRGFKDDVGSGSPTDLARQKEDAANQSKAAADQAEEAKKEAAKKAAEAKAAERANQQARAQTAEQYQATVVARIERAWIRPSNAHSGISCELHITQGPGGVVMAVQVGTCNGDKSVRDSISNAVYRASPLPPPTSPALFDHNLIVTFAPHD
jgi:hypothetical protein